MVLYFLLYRRLFNEPLVLLQNYSICSCKFGVSMGGGDFRVFLCHHLVLSLHNKNLNIQVYHADSHRMNIVNNVLLIKTREDEKA